MNHKLQLFRGIFICVVAASLGSDAVGQTVNVDYVLNVYADPIQGPGLLSFDPATSNLYAGNPTTTTSTTTSSTATSSSTSTTSTTLTPPVIVDLDTDVTLYAIYTPTGTIMPMYSTNLGTAPIEWLSIIMFSNTVMNGTNIIEFDPPDTNTSAVFFHLRQQISTTTSSTTMTTTSTTTSSSTTMPTTTSSSTTTSTTTSSSSTTTTSSTTSTSATSSTTTVPDNEPPMIICPRSILVDPDPQFDNPKGAIVFYAPPIVMDKVDPNPVVNCAPASGIFYALGDHTVTCSATDASGNSNSCTFTIMVRSSFRSDLDIDSDHTHDYGGGPERSMPEDGIEADSGGDVTVEGLKYIVVDDIYDKDTNGIPGYADFNIAPPETDPVMTNVFVPIVVDITPFAPLVSPPAPFDPEAIEVMFVYSASSPLNVTVTEEEGETVYMPEEGHIRLWTMDQSENRSPQPVPGGHFIPPNVALKANDDLGISYVIDDPGPPKIYHFEPKTFYVEGIHPGPGVERTEIYAKFLHSGEADLVNTTVIKADVDVDSNNDDGFNPPEQNLAEDHYEDIQDATNRPGKFICVNDNDDDGDGIPDFADGFDLTAINSDDVVSNEMFTPIIFEIPKPIDLTKAKVRVKYPASVPSDVMVTTNGTYELPAEGALRIWTKAGDQPRNKASLTAGHFVPKDTVFSAEAYGFTNGIRKLTYYVEAVRPSTGIADQRIVFEVDPNGDAKDPPNFIAVDAVRLTVLKLEFKLFKSDNVSTLEQAKKASQGGFLPVNNDDEDRNGTRDKNDVTNSVAGEDDLLRLELSLPMPAALQMDGSLNLRKINAGTENNSTRLKIWQNKEKGTGNLLLDSGVKEKTWDLGNPSDVTEFNTLKTNLWIEAVSASANVRDIDLEFAYQATGEGGDTCKDVIAITAVAQATMASAGVDGSNRIFTAWNAVSTRGEAQEATFATTLMPDGLPGAMRARWYAHDVDDPSGHIHIDPNDVDGNPEPRLVGEVEGFRPADTNDWRDNSGQFFGDMFEEHSATYGITDYLAHTQAIAVAVGGANRPVLSYTWREAEVETAIDGLQLSLVKFEATNDRGDNFMIHSGFSFDGFVFTASLYPNSTSGQLPLTVWTRQKGIVYAMNSNLTSTVVYYPFDGEAASPTRFVYVQDVYGNTPATTDSWGYVELALEDATNRASYASNFTHFEDMAGNGYQLTNNSTLAISVNGGATQVITFTTNQFVAITNALTTEIVTAINATIPNLARRLVYNRNGVGSHVCLRASTSISIVGGTAVSNLGFAVEMVTQIHSRFLPDIADGATGKPNELPATLEYEMYIRGQSDIHNSDVLNPINPDEVVSIYGVRSTDNNSTFGATCRRPHSLINVQLHNGVIHNDTAAHEPGHSWARPGVTMRAVGADTFHATHTSTNATGGFGVGVVTGNTGHRCQWSNLSGNNTRAICPWHIRQYRNSMYRTWTPTDNENNRD